MSNNPNNIDQLQVNQTQKEALANALFSAASSAMLYGRREQTSGGLVWGFYGGVLKTGAGYITINNATVTLANDTNNFIEASLTTGQVTVNQTGFSSNALALYEVYCANNVATQWKDYRQALLSAEAASLMAFTELTDTPQSYVGQANKVVAVNEDENALVFVDASTGGVSQFTSLEDVPQSYEGQEGKMVVVNETATGLEFVDAPTPGGAQDFIQLQDVPNTYAGASKYKVVVKEDEDGLEFVPDTGGGGGSIDWAVVSDDFVNPTATVDAAESMAIGPNAFASGGASGSSSINQTQAFSNIGIFFLASATPGFFAGQTVNVSGYLSTGPVSQTIWSTNGAQNILLLNAFCNYKVGDFAEITNAPNPDMNGEYEILEVSAQTITLSGLDALDSDVENATITATVYSPNGDYVVSFATETQVNVTGWNGYMNMNAEGTVSFSSEGRSTALGVGAQALADNSVALGYGSVATQAGSVAIGGRKITNVSDGTSWNDAATFGQLMIETFKPFTSLYDVPYTYEGAAGKIVVVKEEEDGLEFIDAPAPGGAEAFTELTDTPDTYVGQAGKKVIVKNDETGLEFVPDSGGGGGSDPWTYIVMRSDFLHTAMTNSTVFEFPCVSGQSYLIECFGAYRVTEIANAPTLKISAPLGSFYIGKDEYFTAGNATAGVIQNNATGPTNAANSPTSGSNCPIEGKWIVVAGASTTMRLEIKGKNATTITLPANLFYLRYRILP